LASRERLVAGTVVSAEETPEALVLRVQGRLAIDQIEPLRRGLEEAWRARPRRLILDFSQCPFVDSAGVATVVGAHKHALQAHMAFFLVGVGKQFRDALQVLRLEQVFDIRDSVEAALAT
jgi:anti-anti-sigma factor